MARKDEAKNVNLEINDKYFIINLSIGDVDIIETMLSALREYIQKGIH